MEKVNSIKFIANLYTFIGILFIVGAFVLVSVPVWPVVYYNVNTNATQDELVALGDTQASFTDSFYLQDKSTIQKDSEPELPPINESLSSTNTLIIDSIGVNAQINEGTDYVEVLKYGVWRVNDFGVPDSYGPPTILAAHRFGYVFWSNNFRTTNSFYNLPNTQVGDEIRIIWNKREFRYIITKAEDSTTVNNYDYDLVLYTCLLLNSPERVFRYAERIN